MEKELAQVIESSVRTMLHPHHALIYILVAFLSKLIERGVLSESDVAEVFDSLEEVVRQSDSSESDALYKDEGEVVLAIIDRFRTLLNLE